MSYSMLFLWLSTLLASFFNWLFNIYLNHGLSLDEFSQAFSLFNLILVLAGLALACQYTATKFMPQVRYQSIEKRRQLVSTLTTLGLLLGLLFSLLLLLGQAWWTSYLHLTISTSTTFVLSLTPLVFFSLAIIRGYLLGWRSYWAVGFLLIIESLIKLGVMGLGIYSHRLLDFSLLSVPLSMLFSVLIGLILLNRHTQILLKPRLAKKWLRPLNRFITFSFLTATSAQLLLFVDTITVRHYFPPTQAGIYATVALVGKMIFYFITSIVMIITPEVAIKTAAAQGTQTILKRSILFVVIIGGLLTGFFAFFPQLSLDLFLDPAKIALGQTLILPYGVAVTLVSIVTVMATYYLFAGFHRFIWIVCLGLFFELVAFSLFHSSLYQIIWALLITAFFQVIFIPVVAHFENVSGHTSA